MLRSSRFPARGVGVATSLVALVVVLVACVPLPTTPTLVSASNPGANAPAPNIAHVASAASTPLLFDDEFNGSSLGPRWYPNRWFASTCSAGATSGESQFYTSSRVAVSGGYLRLTASAPSYTCHEGTWAGSKRYSSGWVQTGGASTDTGRVVKPGFSFRYGHVDVRFKEPVGKGLWPAIWLAADGGPGAPQSYPWPPEIDLLESYGNTAIWSFHVHLAGSVSAGKDVVGPITSTGFHTVSLDWRPTKISWSIDGRLAFTYSGPNIPKIPMYLILNLATGGATGATDTKRLPATMLVDWVRIRA
jgi:beta-glucanase (GH16 family)